MLCTFQHEHYVKKERRKKKVWAVKYWTRLNSMLLFQKSSISVVQEPPRETLVWFYGISTIVGYLMPNPVFTYKYMICKHFLIHTVKGSNSSISNNSILHKLTKLNSSNYCYISLTIQLNINHLSRHKWSNSSISNNSIKHKSFTCTQFKCQTVLFDP